MREEPTTLRCVQMSGINVLAHSGDVAVSVPAKDGPDNPRVRVSMTEQVESTQERRRDDHRATEIVHREDRRRADDQTSRRSLEDRTITEERKLGCLVDQVVTDEQRITEI